MENKKSKQLQKKALRKTDVSRRYFLITKVNSYATGVSNIIGITDDEEYAKSMQSVFCAYEEVIFLKK